MRWAGPRAATTTPTARTTRSTWFDWSQPDTELRDFTKRLIALRKAHPVFRRRRFLSGAEASELRWFTPAGTEMTGADWSDENALAIAFYLDGSDDPDRAEDGTPLLDDDFLVLVNAWWEPLDFVLPATRAEAAWQVELDSYDPTRAVAGRHAGDPSPSAPAPLSYFLTPVNRSSPREFGAPPPRSASGRWRRGKWRPWTRSALIIYLSMGKRAAAVLADWKT